jgi:DNA-directed RNA polymerase alpha subunit
MTTFTNLEHTSKKLSVTINNAELSFINSIRRIILAEIPTAGFYFDPTDVEHNDIKITKNTCALHNEFLGHRISLVPLHFDENEINEFEPKKYKFILKKQNNTYESVKVTTKDFEIVDENNKKYSQEFHDKIFPSDVVSKDHILLTKLKANLYDEVSPPRGEMVDLECYPSISTAMKHARWSAVSNCSFGNTVDEALAEKQFADHMQQFEEELGRKATTKEREQRLKRFNTLEVFRCFKKNKYDEADTFNFTIETETRLRPSYLFFKACKILIEKVEKFQNNLKNNIDTVKISALTGVENFYQVEVKHETFTLMNVLQNIIYNISFREGKVANNPIEYIGYYQPHPLDDVMVLKIKLKQFDDVIINKDYLSGLLVDYSSEIIQRLQAFVKEWLNVADKDMKNIKEVMDFKETLA